MRGNGKRRWSGPAIGVSLVLALALIAWSTTWFDEDFEDGSGRWSVGLDATGTGNWRVSAGHYKVLMLHRNALSRSRSPYGEAIEAPYRWESEVQLMPGGVGEAGLLYGCTDESGHEGCRTFGVLSDGSYRLGQIVRGQLEDLPVTTAPKTLRPSHANVLRIVADAEATRFYANDRLLATMPADGTEMTGEIGLFAQSGSEPFFIARFDEVILSLPPAD